MSPDLIHSSDCTVCYRKTLIVSLFYTTSKFADKHSSVKQSTSKAKKLQTHATLTAAAAAGRTYHQPIPPLAHAPPIDGATRHDAPIPIPQLAQPQRLADLARALRARLILLVREHQQRGVPQLVLAQHRGELVGGGREAVEVGGVDDEDDGGGVGVVAAPVGADGGLAAEVL